MPSGAREDSAWTWTPNLCCQSTALGASGHLGQSVQGLAVEVCSRQRGSVTTPDHRMVEGSAWERGQGSDSATHR